MYVRNEGSFLGLCHILTKAYFSFLAHGPLTKHARQQQSLICHLMFSFDILCKMEGGIIIEMLPKVLFLCRWIYSLTWRLCSVYCCSLVWLVWPQQLHWITGCNSSRFKWQNPIKRTMLRHYLNLSKALVWMPCTTVSLRPSSQMPYHQKVGNCSCTSFKSKLHIFTILIVVKRLLFLF